MNVATRGEVLGQLKRKYQALKKAADEAHREMWRKAMNIADGLAGRGYSADQRPIDEKVASYAAACDAWRDAWRAQEDAKQMYLDLRRNSDPRNI